VPAPIFIDTWGWIALFDDFDGAHVDVDTLLREVFGSTADVFTSWPVVSEFLGFCASRRGRRIWGAQVGALVAEKLTPMLDDPDIIREVITSSPSEWSASLDARLKHRDMHALSLVDCTIAVLCSNRSITRVVSGDPHLCTLFPDVRLLPSQPLA